MLVPFACALALVVSTVVVHAACTVVVIRQLRADAFQERLAQGATAIRVRVLALLVVAMCGVAVLEAALWAGAYVMLGALQTMPEALYFSLVTFTTLGYGDVTLPDPWRLLGALEATNGLVMFGWTTAIVVTVAHRILADPQPR